MTSSTDRCQRPASRPSRNLQIHPNSTVSALTASQSCRGSRVNPWHGTSRSPILMHHHTLTAQCIPRVGRRKQPRKENFRSTPRSANTCHFIPVAFESMGGLCAVGQDFVSAIGSRITQISGDPRETDFLRQRLSVALQRGNAACVLSSCKRFIYSDHH